MNYYDNAINALNNKDNQEALKNFKLAVDNEVKAEECRNRMGEIYESIQKFDLAFEMYNRNIKLKNDVESYFRISHLLLNQEKTEQALNFINQGVQFHPHTASIFYMKGLILQSQRGQTEEAIIHFDKCLQRDSSYKEAILRKIECYFEMKEYKSIIEAYNKYMKLEPNNLEAYKKIGNVQILMNQYKNAIDSYLQCIQIDENFAEAYHNLGSVYQMLHQYESAIQIFDQCIAIMLKTAKNSVINSTVNIQNKIGVLTKKKRRILIAQRRKTQEQILSNLVMQRKYEELLLFLDKLLLPWKNLLQKSAEYVSERRKSIAKKGNNKSQGISQRFQQITFLQLSKAKCLKELGRYEESLQALQICEESEQHINECLLLRSKILSVYQIKNNAEKNDEKKEQIQNQVGEQQLDSSITWQEAQRNESKKCLQQIVDSDPTEWKALLQLGDIYEIEKEIPKQIQIYQFILKNDPYNEEAINRLINLSKKGFTIENISQIRFKLCSAKHSQYEHFVYSLLQADSFMEETEINVPVARLLNEGVKFYQRNRYQVENSSSFLKLFFYFSKLYNLSVNQFELFDDSTSPQSMFTKSKALLRSHQITKALEVIETIQKEYSPQTAQQDASNNPQIQQQNGSKLNVLNTQSLVNNATSIGGITGLGQSSGQVQNQIQILLNQGQNLLSKIDGSKAHSSSISKSDSQNSMSYGYSNNPSMKNQYKKIQHLILMVQGECFVKLQMYEKALVCYSDAVRVYPKFYLIYFYRGVLYYKMGLLGDALKNAEKAISLNAFHADSLFLLSKVYAKQQKKTECLNSLQKGLKLLSKSISLTHISDEDDADFLLADSGRIDELIEENNDLTNEEDDNKEFDFFIQQKIQKLQKSNMTSQSVVTERSQSHICEGISSFENNYLEESKFHLESALTEVVNKEEKSLKMNTFNLICIDYQRLYDIRFSAHFYLNQINIKKMDTKNDKQNNNHHLQLSSTINKGLLYLSYSKYNLGINIFFDELFPKYVAAPDSTEETSEAVILSAATHLISCLYSLGQNEKLIKLCEYISEFKKKIKKKSGQIPEYYQEKLPSIEYLIIISIAKYRMLKYDESINVLQNLLQNHLDPARISCNQSVKFNDRYQEYFKLTNFFLSLNYFKQQNISSCLNHLQIYLRETPENQKIKQNSNAAQQLSCSHEILLQHLHSECSFVLMVDLLIQNKLSSEVPVLCEAILESLYEQVNQYSLPTILCLPRQGFVTSCQHILTKRLKSLIIQKIKPQFEGSLRIFFPLMNDENADFVNKLFDFYEYSYFDRQSNLNSHLLVKLEGGQISQIMNPISGKKLSLSELKLEARRVKTSQEHREMLYRLFLNHQCLQKVHFFLKQGRDVCIIQDEGGNQNPVQSLSNLKQSEQQIPSQSNLNKQSELSFANLNNIGNNSRKLISISIQQGDESKMSNHQVQSIIMTLIHLVDCMKYLHSKQIYSTNFSIDTIILNDSNIPILTTFDNFQQNFSSPDLNIQQMIHLIKSILPSSQLTPEQLQQQFQTSPISSSPTQFSNLLIYLYSFLNKYPNSEQKMVEHNIAPSDFDIYNIFINELNSILHSICIACFLFQGQSTFKQIDSFYINFIQGILQINKLSTCKNILPLMNTQEKDILISQKVTDSLFIEYNQFFNQIQISVELPYLLNDEMYALVNRFIQISQLDIIQKQELINELYTIKCQYSSYISEVKSESRSKNIMKLVDASDGRDEFILSLVSSLDSLMAIQDDIDSKDQNQLFSYLISLINNPLKDDFFERFIKRKKVYHEWKQELQQDILKRIVRQMYADNNMRTEKFDKFVRVLQEYQVRSKNESVSLDEQDYDIHGQQGVRFGKSSEDGTLLDDVDCVIEGTTSANSYSIQHQNNKKDNRSNINVMNVFTQRPILSAHIEDEELFSFNQLDQQTDRNADQNNSQEQKNNNKQQNQIQYDDVIPKKVQESEHMKSDKDSKGIGMNSLNTVQKNQSNVFLKDANVTESIEYSQPYHQKNVQNFNCEHKKNEFN